MSAHNRVIWSEGLFLQPQHFQQQERYFERYVETRCQPLTPNSWGFTEVEFERDLLTIGKFALRRVAGVFPDGTPFQDARRRPAAFPDRYRCRRPRSSSFTCSAVAPLR